MSFVNNEFAFIGNLTKDPELRHTSSGTPTITFTLAVNTEYLDGKGNPVKETDFIPITTYGKQAENDSRYLKKGSQVAVKGRVRSWYNKDEKKGGINFEAAPGCVMYLGRPSGASGTREQATGGGGASGEGDWARDYASAEQNGAGSTPRKV